MSGQVAGGMRRRAVGLPRIETRSAVGLLVVVAAIVLVLQVLQQAQITTPVVVASRHLPAGHLIQPGDLTVAEARLEGALASLAMPAGDQQLAVGRTTVVPVRAGALVLRPDLGSGPSIGPGEVAVTLPLRADEVYPGLRPGDRVMVVSTSGDVRAGSGSETVLHEARVFHVSLEAARLRVSSGDDDAVRPSNVTLVVPATAAERLARAIVSERVTLIFLAAEPAPGEGGAP